MEGGDWGEIGGAPGEEGIETKIWKIEEGVERGGEGGA